MVRLFGRTEERPNMKKMAIILAVGLVLGCGVIVQAGEVRTLPQDISVKSPTSNKVELISQTYEYGNPPRLLILYYVLDPNTGDRLKSEQIIIRNIPDDPATPEDETDNQFNAFVSGFGSTMYTRGDTAIWQDIQSKYTLVP